MTALDHSVLDDPSTRSRLDSGSMLRAIDEMPEQCREAWTAAQGFELPWTEAPERIVILGLGGSAIAGDYFRALLALESYVPVFNVRGYELPPFVDDQTLVIASSFSGETEEVLSAFEQALATPTRKLVLAVCESVKETVAEDGDKRIWVIDVREERQPVMVSSFPTPKPAAGLPWTDYDQRPRRFGPHNVHELRPSYGYRSEYLIFSTWYNAGLRITDLSDPSRPEDVGYFVPPPPPNQAAPQINDVFVDNDRLIYLTDRYNGGLYVVEYEGPDISD